MDEISNGTSRYQSLHNLTEQVEHQYHGRFLIELIQNAHDALEPGVMGAPQRIEIVLAENECQYGTLYVANDGPPFTLSNFKALSNLGQSDKDPQKSIGNKGIGFRSVLEITKAPEIYSRKERESSSFDGYCFRFQPDVIQMFEEPIHRIVKGDNNVEAPEAIGGPLLNWDDDGRYDRFRERCRSFEKDWLRKELDLLSPYVLPIPMDSQPAASKVADFEQRGFSTVIRLPLLNRDAREIVINKMEEMNGSTAIFLQRVNVLRFASENHDRCYQRKQIRRDDDPEEGFEVKITTDSSETEGRHDQYRRYWLWKRTVGGEENPNEQEEIQSAVTGLPGKWPEVDEATVEIVVQVGNAPDDGVFNIYLPTQVPSGCAAHLSAPFFGDMSRTDIDFKNSLNSLLLRTIAEKGVDVILNSLSGKGADEAAAIIDILAPTDSNEGKRWWDALEEVFSTGEIEIESYGIALSNEGWCSFVHTRLLPDHESNIVISTALLRSEATYPVFVQELQEREKGIKRIFEEVNIDPEAKPEDNAATIEAIAKKLHESREPVDWNGFWQDVEALIVRDTTPLKGKRVLLGTDNQLHSCDDRCSVFFRPRSSGSDDEVSAEGGIGDIPENLRPFIAFLNEGIQTHTLGDKGGFKTTAVHRYLSTGLVQSYGVERIFSDVLVKATPKLPHDIDGPDSQLCRDILQWGLRLLQASKHSMEESIRLLSELLAPCIGGWYPIGETSFGPGWSEKSGDKLNDYLRRTDTRECGTALKRLLLPPDHPLWGGMGLSSVDLLEKAGAFNGIRLVPVTDKDWDARFTVGPRNGVVLPEKSPAGYSSDIWGAYRKYIKDTEKPNYSGEFSYEVQPVYALPGFALPGLEKSEDFDVMMGMGEPLYTLPGLEKSEDFDDESHKRLMELLLASIPFWKNWENVTIRKVSGARRKYSLDSPLAFLLKKTKWMQGEVDEETIRFRPSDRWYIPLPEQRGGLHLFSHLKPMPASVTSALDANSELVKSMQGLGMSRYDTEEETADPKLLNDLAVALEDAKIDINRSAFLGQVRTAWQQFCPDGKNVFPRSIIVQNGSGSLRVVTPTQEEAVYLPDATSAVHDGLKLHSKPVAMMESRDAKRLQEGFQKAYENGVCLASELTMRPLVDGSPWQSQDNMPQLSEELPWLSPVVLSIFAFSGDQGHGTSTKTFTKAIDTLRGARIVWVDTLEAGLWRGDESVARTSVPALWLAKDKTLLVISNARTEVSQLSEALVSIVGRGDIDIRLRHILENCERADEKSDDVLCKYLGKQSISVDHYQEVKQRWLGDFALQVRLVRPLILLVQPDADIAPLDGVSSDEQFRDALQSYSIAPDVLSIVKGAVELESVGRKAFEILGDQAQLDQWNKVLLQAGEPLISNEKADEEFQEHLDSCRTIMRSIIRHTIRKHPESRGFKDYEDDLLRFECPEEYKKEYWAVAFPDVMKKVCNILVKWDTCPDVVELVERSTSAEGLREQLDKLDLEPDRDPIEIHADNCKIFFEVLEDIQKSALAWCIREKVEVGIWGEDKSFFKEQLTDDFAKAAFIDDWDEAMCFKLIRKSNRSQVHEGFWTALDKSSTVRELMNGLDISDNKMAKAREQLEERKQEQELQKKTVKVCGKDFVNSEENLSSLSDHISGAIKDDRVARVDLSDLEELKEQGESKRRKRDHKKSTNKKKPKGRMSQAMKDLVGLAGEIHAFRALQKFYGVETVGPSSWISENSLRKYPENNTDDGCGCDFVIRENGITHYVEVKATQAEDEAFELGSSEVKLAIDSANRRKKKFVILHVLNALSDNPQCRLLPNPYDKKYKSKYKIEGAGLRVRYETTT